MGKITSTLIAAIKKNDTLHFTARRIRDAINLLQYNIQGEKVSDEKITCRKFKNVFGKYPDLTNPKTLNEKIQWLKLHDRKDIYTTLADKYAVREWLAKRFGEQYLIPLLFTTTDWHEVKPENIPDIPCIIKSNHAAGLTSICRDKYITDWKHVQRVCRYLMNVNYYYNGQEWQYKNIKPRIIIERLLLDKNGKIPNDYKLHFINGNLEFVYCSIDREGKNYRNIYSPDWTPLYFTWVAKKDIRADLRGPEISPPASFAKMVEIGSRIAKLFTYVRVDFYDVDGKLYYGEITLHHGGGYDVFLPESYDLYYGQKLDLNAPVLEDI